MEFEFLIFDILASLLCDVEFEGKGVEKDLTCFDLWSDISKVQTAHFLKQFAFISWF